MGENLSGFTARHIFHSAAHQNHRYENPLHKNMEVKNDEIQSRNEIKSYIVRSGCTMQEVVDLLHDEHGWSDSVSNLSNKLQRESLRYTETVQLADALGYEIVWQKRK